MSSANQLVTRESLGNVYHRLKNADSGTADIFKSFLSVARSVAELNQNDPQRNIRATQALQHLSSFIKALKEKGPTDVQYTRLDHEFSLLNSQGTDLITQLKAGSKDTIKKIFSAASDIFKNSQEVEMVLQNEANRQDMMIQFAMLTGGVSGLQTPRQDSKSAKLADGLIGLYEIATKRPNLQQDLTNNGIDRKFLMALSKPLNTIIRSFSEVKGSTSEEEGSAALSFLIGQVFSHHNSLKDLYPENSETESFINGLIALKNNKEGQKALYDNLRQASLLQCKKSASSPSESGIGAVELLSFFNSKAEELSSSIPAAMKGDIAVIAKHVAGSFKTQQEHGQGALLHGTGAEMRSYFGDQFGSGINDARHDPNIIVDPYSGVSLGSVKNQKAQGALKAFGDKAVRNYYEQRQLASSRITVEGSIIHEKEISDPIHQALGTVDLVINYEIAQYRRDHLIIGDLDAAQKQALIPVLAKKVVLFGIKNDIFSLEQGEMVLIKYPSLRRDNEVEEAIRAALIRYATNERKD